MAKRYNACPSNERTVVNIPGDTGAQGPVGPEGPQGATGNTGERGEQGERGVRGKDGPRGYEGQAGPQGYRGEKGDSGITQFDAEPCKVNGKPGFIVMIPTNCGVIPFKMCAIEKDDCIE